MPHPDPAGDDVETRLIQRAEQWCHDDLIRESLISEPAAIILGLLSLVRDLQGQVKELQEQATGFHNHHVHEVSRLADELRLARAVVEADDAYDKHDGAAEYMARKSALAAYRAAYPATEKEA